MFWQGYGGRVQSVVGITDTPLSPLWHGLLNCGPFLFLGCFSEFNKVTGLNRKLIQPKQNSCIVFCKLPVQSIAPSRIILVWSGFFFQFAGWAKVQWRESRKRGSTQIRLTGPDSVPLVGDGIGWCSGNWSHGMGGRFGYLQSGELWMRGTMLEKVQVLESSILFGYPVLCASAPNFQRFYIMPNITAIDRAARRKVLSLYQYLRSI